MRDQHADDDAPPSLHKAAAQGNDAACRRLLQDHPACLDSRDAFGRCALHVCLHLPVAAALLRAGADTAVCRQGLDIATWHRSRGRDEIASLIELRRAPARIQQQLAADAVEDAVACGTEALQLAERWLAGTALVDEIRLALQSAQDLRQALSAAHRLFSAEEYAQARDAFTHAASIAPASARIAARLAQLEPLCRMQAKLRKLEAERESTPQCVASAALTPPRGQKTLSRTRSGRQAINAAAVHRLLDSGASLNERDEQGRTALLWSAENGLADLVSLLLTRTEGERADPNITDSKGRSALHLAQTPAVASMLLRAGSERQMKNADGRTPEAQHRRYGRFDVAELITEQGEILHLQGVAERRLMHGDAHGASDTYRDALELCRDEAAKDDSPAVSAIRQSIRQSLVAGQKRASEVAEALSSASAAATDDVLKGAAPLVVPLPPSSGGSGRLEDDAEKQSLFRRVGGLQAILNHRAAGRWSVTRCMGLGSSGLVVSATDTIRQEVAVKLVLPEPEQESFSKAEVRRLRREAQAMMRVQDPHVCAAFESFFFPSEHHPAAFVLILEAVNGPTLAAELKTATHMSEVNVACICSDVLRGLAAVHSAGLVHRDIKPENIARADGGGSSTAGLSGESARRQLHKLLDFGLARAMPEAELHEEVGCMSDTLLAHTQDGNHQAAGTPHYMSPEHWSPEHWGTVDARSDLWAVGVLAYRMLTGRLPFAHEKTDMLGVWSAVVGEPMASIKSFNPDVSAGMNEWVSKALQKKQGDRFSSAVEMAEGLQRALVADKLARYNVFLSYRVKSEHALALSLFNTISAVAAAGPASQTAAINTAPQEERLTVYLDKVRLIDGQRWDQGFVDGLGSSDVFVPLISVGALEPMTRLQSSSDSSSADNVLLEWMVALWLYQHGHIKSILPLLLGDVDASTDGGGWCSLFDGLARMERDGRTLPGVVHEPTRAKAVDAVQQLGLGAGKSRSALEDSFNGMSVAKTAETIMCFQGVTMWDAGFDRESAVKSATERVAKSASSLLVGGGGSGGPGLPVKHQDTAGTGAGGSGAPKLGSMLASSVMGMLQLRQELAQSKRHAASQAQQIAELSMQVRTLTGELDRSNTALTTAQHQHPRGSYAGGLLSQLQADNDRLQRKVAKWKDLATVRQSELKTLRNEHVALAHQATETRQLAYQICTGHGRLNSNSSARLQLELGARSAGASAAARKQKQKQQVTTLRRPLLRGGGGGEGDPDSTTNSSSSSSSGGGGGSQYPELVIPQQQQQRSDAATATAAAAVVATDLNAGLRAVVDPSSSSASASASLPKRMSARRARHTKPLNATAAAAAAAAAAAGGVPRRKLSSARSARSVNASKVNAHDAVSGKMQMAHTMALPLVRQCS
jgi:serine/threonine protein kinase